MASTRRKAAAAGLAVIGIAGLSLAAAAQLNINSGSLGAGSIAVGSCDDEVDVTYERAWNATAGADVTTAVNFDNVAAECDGLDYELTVLGADDDAIGTFAGTDLELSDDAFSIEVEVNTALIEGIALVIHG